VVSKAFNHPLLSFNGSVFKQTLLEEWEYYTNNLDVERDRSKLDLLKAKLNNAIKHQDKLGVDHILEYCFLRKKVQLLDTALLDFKSRVNHEVEEGSLFNWCTSMSKNLVMVQLFGVGENSVMTEVFTECVNK